MEAVGGTSNTGDKPITIVDGNYQVCRAIYSGGNLEHNGLFTDGIYKFLKTLKSIEDLGKPIIVFDDGISFHRREIHPEYKVRDKPKDEELDAKFRFTYSTLDKLLPVMGIPSIRIPNQEADDVIYRLVQRLIKKGSTVYVVSDDADMLQMINLGARIYKPMKQEHWNINNFSEREGFDPKFFVIFKSIVGDPSDVIDGVKGVGKVGAKKIIAELDEPTIPAIRKWIRETNNKTQEKVKAQFPKLKRNIQLVDINKTPLSQDWVWKSYIEAREFANVDVDQLREFFKDLGFKSLNSWLVRLSQRGLGCGR